MLHQLLCEFMGTALMIIFGVGVHCDEVLKKTKYSGSGHLFAITTWAFGITIVLYIFDGVFINPAMALAEAILGQLPWIHLIPVIIAECAGAFVGALITYVLYADHFKASVDEVPPENVRNIFSTNPLIRTLPRNYFVEFFATFIFITAILSIAVNHEEMTPIGVGLLVWAIGMGLGGPTGFAMNQARDLGPRLAYQVLPIKNKMSNDWAYGLLVPGTAPFLGAALAAVFSRYFLHLL